MCMGPLLNLFRTLPFGLFSFVFLLSVNFYFCSHPINMNKACKILRDLTTILFLLFLSLGLRKCRTYSDMRRTNKQNGRSPIVVKHAGIANEWFMFLLLCPPKICEDVLHKIYFPGDVLTALRC